MNTRTGQTLESSHADQLRSGRIIITRQPYTMPTPTHIIPDGEVLVDTPIKNMWNTTRASIVRATNHIITARDFEPRTGIRYPGFCMSRDPGCRMLTFVSTIMVYKY